MKIEWLGEWDGAVVLPAEGRFGLDTSTEIKNMSRGQLSISDSQQFALGLLFAWLCVRENPANDGQDNALLFVRAQRERFRSIYDVHSMDTHFKRGVETMVAELDRHEDESWDELVKAGWHYFQQQMRENDEPIVLLAPVA